MVDTDKKIVRIIECLDKDLDEVNLRSNRIGKHLVLQECEPEDDVSSQDSIDEVATITQVKAQVHSPQDQFHDCIDDLVEEFEETPFKTISSSSLNNLINLDLSSQASESTELDGEDQDSIESDLDQYSDRFNQLYIDQASVLDLTRASHFDLSRTGKLDLNKVSNTSYLDKYSNRFEQLYNNQSSMLNLHHTNQVHQDEPSQADIRSEGKARSTSESEVNPASKDSSIQIGQEPPMTRNLNTDEYPYNFNKTGGEIIKKTTLVQSEESKLELSSQSKDVSSKEFGKICSSTELSEALSAVTFEETNLRLVPYSLSSSSSSSSNSSSFPCSEDEDETDSFFDAQVIFNYQ